MFFPLLSLEWWTFELLLLLAGLLPDSKLETSVLSVWYSS
jgi:MATE family multidrug resistance protein